MGSDSRFCSHLKSLNIAHLLDHPMKLAQRQHRFDPLIPSFDQNVVGPIINGDIQRVFAAFGRSRPGALYTDSFRNPIENMFKGKFDSSDRIFWRIVMDALT